MVLNIILQLFLLYISLFGGHIKYKPIIQNFCYFSIAKVLNRPVYQKSTVSVVCYPHNTHNPSPNHFLSFALCRFESMQELSANVSFKLDLWIVFILWRFQTTSEHSHGIRSWRRWWRRAGFWAARASCQRSCPLTSIEPASSLPWTATSCLCQTAGQDSARASTSNPYIYTSGLSL